MREKISVYVDELFSDAALTIRNAEVQQEILQHTLDRYDDLIAAGKTPEELLRDVSSAKGTTVAALEAFDAFGLDEALKKGVDAANRRSEELANA